MRILFFQDESELLKRLCLSRPFGPFFVNWLGEKMPFQNGPSYALLPNDWLHENPSLRTSNAFAYEAPSWEIPDLLDDSDADEICMLNGGALFAVDEKGLDKTLHSLSWDVVSVQICPHLQASNEILKLTPQNRVVGFRRLYALSVEPAEQPPFWPNMMIFKKNAWIQTCQNRRFPMDFGVFMEKVRQFNLNLVNVRVGGQVMPLDSKAAFLNCLNEFKPNGNGANGTVIHSNVKVVGPVLKGKDVTIEPGVTLIGPIVLSDGVHVKSDSIIRRSVLGENTTVEKGCIVSNQIWLDQADVGSDNVLPDFAVNSGSLFSRVKEYRKWPLCSYQRVGKRIFDVVCASVILFLLIPVFPLIMLIIKLTSPGPIFYKARRQGLHGAEFDCLKFRTMMLQADSIQERLRVINEVDGPQFKIDNDPRISGVGKFLRDTCIDELPQFINVLLGQMSVVGPRPSPENENDSCPVWRDARLSVRPGITGLWQICRTRQNSSDFQEWVYYDTQYVRNLSFRKDLWICFKTATKLIKAFLGQFG